MKDIKYILLVMSFLFGIAFSFSRCKEIQPVIPDVTMKVDIERNISLNANPADFTITLTTVPSGIDWGFTSNATWLTASQRNQLLTVKVEPNTEETSRSDTITIYPTAIHYDDNIRIFITQSGLRYNVEPDTIWTSSQTTDIFAAVESNIEGWAFTPAQTDTWYSVTKADGGVNIHFDENETDEVRSSVINVRFGDIPTDYPIRIYQTYPGFETYLEVDQDELLFDSYDLTQRYVGVNAGDLEWVVRVEPSAQGWLTATRVNREEGQLQVSVVTNTTQYPRTAVITLRGLDGETSATVTVVQKAGLYEQIPDGTE